MPRNIPRVNAARGSLGCPAPGVERPGSVPHFYTKGDTPYYLALPAGLRGIGPALAGRLGGGGAFALSREGLK